MGLGMTAQRCADDSRISGKLENRFSAEPLSGRMDDRAAYDHDDHFARD
jgi:hypothetical protein